MCHVTQVQLQLESFQDAKQLLHVAAALRAVNVRYKFSKVSSLLHYLCKMSTELIFQKLYQRGSVICVWCSEWQCIAMCCSVLQCVAVCCSVLQCMAVYCSVLQCVAVCCSVLQCIAMCCNVLQCVAAWECVYHLV